MEVHSIKSLFGSGGAAKLTDEARTAIQQADVIIGVDSGSQREFTVFGTPSLEQTMQVGEEVSMDTLRVEIDEKAGDLARLISAVRSIKGR